MRSFRQKIKPLRELSELVKKHKLAGKKIVLSHGVFDLIHYGHMHYLEEAKKLGDILIVSAVKDCFVRKGPGRPVFNENIRVRSLASLEAVDYVVLCEELGPWKVLQKIRPNVYAKGDDSKELLKDPKSGLNKDKRIVEKFGGELEFTRSLPIHSAELLKNYFNNFRPEVEKFLSEFRTAYSPQKVVDNIEQLKKLKVLVIGEAIIDEYRYVMPLGKANKANVISAQYLRTEEFAGGILACANHVASICNHVDLVTYLGEENSKEEFIRSKLKSNVHPKFFYCPGQPTIIKRRFVDPAYYFKFFEESIFDRNFLPSDEENKIGNYLKHNLRNYDLVIVVDYGHGFLSSNLIQILSQKAKFLAVNAQTNSGNAGFNYITKYPRVNFACLDEIEARLAVHDNSSPIEEVLIKLVEKIGTARVIVTQGHLGSMSYHPNEGIRRIPSLSRKITDPIGAGDAFLAISAPCAMAGYPMELVAFMGNVAGSIAVEILGNKSFIEKKELYRQISYLLE